MASLCSEEIMNTNDVNDVSHVNDVNKKKSIKNTKTTKTTKKRHFIIKNKLNPDKINDTNTAKMDNFEIINQNDHVTIPSSQRKMKVRKSMIDTSITKNTQDCMKVKEDTNMVQHMDDNWEIINSYFKGQHLNRMVRHQIESYNDFVNYQIKRTIQMFNPLHIKSAMDYDQESGRYALEMLISFENFRLYRPQTFENNGATKVMFPQEARLRNFTYGSAMTVDIHIKSIRRYGSGLEEMQSQHKCIPDIHIGKLPVMVKSSICVLNQYSHISSDVAGECRHDAGGYFIINGSEKVVIAQERAAENKVYCFHTPNNTKWSWTAEIKSVPDHKIISPKHITMYLSKKNNGFGYPIMIQIPRVKKPVPLFVIFRALGIESDYDISKKIILTLGCDTDKLSEDDRKTMEQYLYALRGTIVDANNANVLNQEQGIDYLTSHVMYTPMNMTDAEGCRKKLQFAKEVLAADLYPHCRTKAQKIQFLGYMAYRLLSVSLGKLPEDDRDSYVNKRMDLTGSLLNNLFRNYFNKLVKDMQKQIVREINNGSWRSTDDYRNIITKTNIYKIVKSSTIENGIKRALSTGDFGIKSVNSNKQGVAQLLNRLTYISSLSHLRRVNTPIDKNGKLVAPRKLHSTTWGFICPAETPEGQPVGVVKNLSYMAHVTIPSNSTSLYEILEGKILKVDDPSVIDHPELLANMVKVFVNGNWIGVTHEPKKLFAELKQKKHDGIINIYTGIVFDVRKMEIRMCNESGRLMRPVLRVKDNKLILTKEIIEKVKSNQISWDDLLSSKNPHVNDAVIEYIDADEQNTAMIAMKPYNVLKRQSESQMGSNMYYNFTHCEIHPSTIFGILASCIPFPEHNQSPRNTYQCAMGKQAMGMYATNFNSRMEKTPSYVLTYSMRPMVDTRVMNMLHLNNVPSGEMVIVAIGTYSGYNQEDSIIFNKGSIDRGLFAATIYHTEKDEDKKVYGDEEIRCRPDQNKTKGMKFANYSKLTNKGLIPENTRVEDKDIIIGKVVPIKENRNDHTKVIKFSDQSRMINAQEDEETFIDKNYVERNGDGYTFCKVRLRTYRKPVIGDKFSSRHGQKGTIGLILPEEDIPFMANGVRPDIIINPHAIPSRMTIGQLKETLLGKVLLEIGLYGDGTSFNEHSVKDIAGELLKCGFESHGNELLMNGMTGEQLETSIFIGPAFYQRLKHMVNDKYHSRGIGPMVVLTRQPAEGRARDGGFRFGEMERDCMLSHGASRFTRGRMYDSSDAYETIVCRKCGMIAAVNEERGIHKCLSCDNHADFAKVQLPYACKLLFQEMITMNVAPRLITE